MLGVIMVRYLKDYMAASMILYPNIIETRFAFGIRGLIDCYVI